MPAEGTRPLLESNGSQTRYDMSQKMEGQKRKRVLVVGAGAAGKQLLLNKAGRMLSLISYCRNVLRPPPLQPS